MGVGGNVSLFRNSAIIGLVISLGFGYDLEDDGTHESRDFKGILQIEQAESGYSYGFLHSSQVDNGIQGSPEDQNIFYFKKNFKLN